jgi:nucleoside-diphosphate-sugar epimerase
MEAALEEGVLKVAPVSTFVVWGNPAQSPFDEETPVGPRSTEYAESKYEGDQVVWKLYRERELPMVVLYPGGVLGAGDPKSTGQYIRDLIERRVPGMVFEASALTWVHAEDVAEAIVRALEKGATKARSTSSASTPSPWGSSAAWSARSTPRSAKQ